MRTESAGLFGGGESWNGSITSPAGFRILLEEALYDARRFADAYPDVYIYQSIIGILDGLLRMTADLHRPTDNEKMQFEAMVPIIRAQAGDANKNLLHRVDAIWAYVLEWPVLPPKPEVPADPAEAGIETLPMIVALDDLVVAIHWLRGSLKKSRLAVKDGVKGGSTVARAIQETAQAIEREMEESLKLLEAWVDPQRGSSGHDYGREDAIMRMPQFLAHYLPERAAEILQVRGSFAAWKERTRTPIEGVEVASFEQFVRSLHMAMYEAAELGKLDSDRPALPKLSETIEWLRSPIRDWITDLELRADRETPIAETLSQDLDLLPWQQLPNVLKNVRMLAEMLVNWTAEAMPFFRQTLYETVIDVHLLQAVSATSGLDDVARNLEQLQYRTAGGKIPPPHERKEIRLDEAFERELRIYTSPVLASFLTRVRGIDAFWRRWNPPVKKAREPAEAKPARTFATLATRHEAERAALVAVQQGVTEWSPPDARDEIHESGDYDPIAEARGLSREYFRHLLDSSIKNMDVLPMRFPFTRALVLELRAIRRATDRFRTPTAEEQRLIGRGFAAISLLVPGVENPSHQRILNEVWQAHLYFQLIAGTVPSAAVNAPAGMLADTDEFKAAVADVLSDAACLAVLFPNSDVWVDTYRQLERLSQRVEYGRELTETEKAGVERALDHVEEPPAELFANLPAFGAGFVDRVHQVFNFARGRRVTTRAAFDELLRAVLAETPAILTGRNWDDDQTPLSAIDRQLRAMRRWTAGGRLPSAAERDATREALATVGKLRGLDRMTEWAARIGELTLAFCDDLPAGDNAALASDGEVASANDFGILLDECIRDCKSMSGQGMFHKPVGPEVAWSDARKQLDKIRRMLDQNVVPTRLQRGEIHAAISAFDPAAPSPCPAIHDFMPDITARLARVDQYYAWLVTSGPYAGNETGNIDEAGVQCVSLGGEMRVAFVRTGGTDPGIYVSMAEKVCTKEQAGDIQVDLMRYLPSTRNLIKLVPCEGWLPAEIRWNAHSDFLAYRIAGATPEVGWSETRKAGEKGRVNANAFAWATSGSNFIAIDLASRMVFRMNAENGQKRNLVPLPDDVSQAIVPRIVIAPDGGSLLFTCGPGAGGIDLCLLEFAGAKPVMRVRKSFPAATAVYPFVQRNGPWACLVDRVGGSDIMTIPFTESDEEILFTSPLPAAPAAPSWSNNGKFIAFLNPQPAGEPQLVLFDCDTQELIPMTKPGAVRGRLSFGDECICIEDADAGTIVWPHISHQRAAVEKF